MDEHEMIEMELIAEIMAKLEKMRDMHLVTVSDAVTESTTAESNEIASAQSDEKTEESETKETDESVETADKSEEVKEETKDGKKYLY